MRIKQIAKEIGKPLVPSAVFRAMYAGAKSRIDKIVLGTEGVFIDVSTLTAGPILTIQSLAKGDYGYAAIYGLA